MHVSYEEAVARGWVAKKDVPRNAKKATGKKSDQEGQEQAQLIKQFREEFPKEGPLLIHIPNGGSRKNAYEGWRLKEQGVRAGVSDLFLPVPRNGFHGLWLEFKAAPPNNAALSTSQKEWLDLMRGQGYQALHCLGVAAAMEALRSYLLEQQAPVAPASANC